MQKSNGIVTKNHIKSAYPVDNESHSGISLPNERGGKMGGSPTNLAHSLSGASAVQGGHSMNARDEN